MSLLTVLEKVLKLTADWIERQKIKIIGETQKQAEQSKAPGKPSLYNLSTTSDAYQRLVLLCKFLYGSSPQQLQRTSTNTGNTVSIRITASVSTSHVPHVHLVSE